MDKYRQIKGEKLRGKYFQAMESFARQKFYGCVVVAHRDEQSLTIDTSQFLTFPSIYVYSL